MYVSFPTGHSNAPLPGNDAATSDDFSHLTPNLHVNLEVLAADIAEMENQIFHLNRSNKELREFLEKEPDEKEYQSAIFDRSRLRTPPGETEKQCCNRLRRGATPADAVLGNEISWCNFAR